MEFLRKYKSLLIMLLALFFAGTGLYLDRTLSKQANALTQEINTRQEKLKGYYANIETAPSQNKVLRLTRDKITLEGNYESVSSRYALVPVLTLPEGEIFPVLYYKEKMYSVLDDLHKQSASKAIALSYGITESGLPSAEQVPGLLVLLDTVKRLSEEVFRSKITSLDSIQFGTPLVSSFYIEIPLEITVSGSSSRLAYFFENLGSSQTIFVLENMAMVRGGGGGGGQAAAVPGAPGGPPTAGPGGPGPAMQAVPVISVDAGENFTAYLKLKRVLWGQDLVEKIKLVTVSAPTSQGAGPGGRPGMPPGAPGMPPGAPGGTAPGVFQPPKGLQRAPAVE